MEKSITIELCRPDKTCKPQDLQQAINMLPYQIAPSALMHKLNTCQQLSDKAKLIWNELYSLKDIHLHTVVYNLYRLATTFNVSPKTIKRAIQQLMRTGWLKPTEYAGHGGVTEFQVTMPMEVFECIIQGNHRKERPLYYENCERHYCKDINGKVLFTYYLNPNGTNVIILNEGFDIHDVANKLQASIIHGEAANQSTCTTTEQTNAPNEAEQPAVEQPKLLAEPAKTSEIEIEIKTKIDALQEKISSSDLPNHDKYKLVRVLHGAMNDLDEVKTAKAKGDKLVPLPINKYKTKITNNVANISPRENRYADATMQAGENTPIHYRNVIPVIIPDYFVRKVDEAIKTYRESISDPVGVRKELLWAISRQFVGKPKDKPNASFNDIMRFNTCVAIKKIKLGEWTSPAGFTPREVIEASIKAEHDKEHTARRSVGRSDGIDSLTEAASIKAMLEKSGRV